MENKSNILSVIAIIGLVLISVLLIVRDDSPTKEPPKTLTVTGTSELTVSPDQAQIYISIITEADTADMAQAKSKEISAKVIDVLKRSGIAAADIETSTYYLSRKSEWNPEKMKSVDTNYTLTHTLKVTTTDIEDVGKFVDAAVNAGANGIDSIQFSLSKAEEQRIRAESLTKATEAAKKKASSLASTAGVELDDISSISESSFYYTPYSVNYGINMISPKAESASMISPQKVDVSGSVTLVYELADN